MKHWQPKYFSDGKGGKFAPACLTPHWGNVKTLMLDSANQFRCIPPPSIGSRLNLKRSERSCSVTGNLTNEQKGLVEFMRDGPRSVQQAGHWFIFAQDVSVRDNHTLDQDVKMYFAVEAAAMDGLLPVGIQKWNTILHVPTLLVHYYLKTRK
jgi:hypothetical protein